MTLFADPPRGPSEIRFLVFGDPKPKGSPQIVTKGRGGVPLKSPRVVDDSPAMTRWAKAVGASALAALSGRVRPVFKNTPLAAEITFVMPAPGWAIKHHAKLGQWPFACFALGDGDKLERATWDPLHGLVFDNDSRIVEWTGRKTYDGPAYGLNGTGAVIRIWSVGPEMRTRSK